MWLVAASGNFIKLEEGTEIDHLGTTYDYGSVLHYSETAFAIDDSQPTIETINPPNSEIGQRIEMSQLDSERVQILYGCLAIVSQHICPCYVTHDVICSLLDLLFVFSGGFVVQRNDQGANLQTGQVC